MLCLLGLATSTLTAQATTPVPEQKQEVIKFDSKALTLVDFKITNVVLTTEIDFTVNDVVQNNFAVKTAVVKEKIVLHFSPYRDVGWQSKARFSNSQYNYEKNKVTAGKFNENSVIRIRADC